MGEWRRAAQRSRDTLAIRASQERKSYSAPSFTVQRHATTSLGVPPRPPRSPPRATSITMSAFDAPSSHRYGFADHPASPETDADALTFDSEWLNALPSHPIFTPAESSRRTLDKSHVPSSNVVLNGSTLYVAQGRQLRQISLITAKHAALEGLASGSSVQSVLAGETYTLLKPELRQDRRAASSGPARSTTPRRSAIDADWQDAHFDFDIRSLVVNPTGRLIAVVGSHRLVVLVLPRSTQSIPRPAQDGQAVTTLTCLADRVGEWYHDERASNDPDNENSIVDVQWHPWGADGLSLLVCTRDGSLR